MKATINDNRAGLGAARFPGLIVSLAVVSAVLGGGDARAEPAKAEGTAAIGGGAVARILPPAEKIKVLEEELAKEIERRTKADEEVARRTTENNELTATAKVAGKDRAALEARLADTADRESKLQKTNERLRAENERIAVTVRLALPIVTAVAIAILAMLVYTFLFLRKIAARVHTQRTLSEMHEIETRLAHVTDQYNAEVKRNQTLRHKLAELGIVD